MLNMLVLLLSIASNMLYDPESLSVVKINVYREDYFFHQQRVLERRDERKEATEAKAKLKKQRLVKSKGRATNTRTVV
jgi:hypothetical protein